MHNLYTENDSMMNMIFEEKTNILHLLDLILESGEQRETGWDWIEMGLAMVFGSREEIFIWKRRFHVMANEEVEDVSKTEKDCDYTQWNGEILRDKTLI